MSLPGYLRTIARAVLGRGTPRPQAAGRLGDPYTAGGINRLNKDWLPANRSADDAIGANWDLLTARVRDLARNEPSIRAAHDVLVDHTVGLGIGVKANVRLGKVGSDTELNDEFNIESNELWDDWCETEADIEGKQTFGDMQRLLFGEAMDAGEAFLLRCASPDPDRFVPLCYQVLEADQLDSSMDRPADANGVRIVRGIELDRTNRPLAYWLFGANPQDSRSSWAAAQRIPAERVIHYYLPTRPNQARGVTRYSAVVQSARDRDWLLGNTLTKAAIQAIFTAVIKSKIPGTGVGISDGSTDTQDSYGNTRFRLGRGTVAQIGSEDEITPVYSSTPSGNEGAFIKLLWQQMAMGLNVSYLRLTRDYSQTNYSSAKAAHEDDYTAFRPLSRNVGARICRPVRAEWTKQMVAFGRFDSLSPVLFNSQRLRWLRAKLVLPGRRQLDQLKETDAAIARMDNCLSTLEDECAALDKDWRAVILQKATEAKFAKAKGVALKGILSSPKPPGYYPSDPPPGGDDGEEDVIPADDQEDDQDAA